MKCLSYLVHANVVTGGWGGDLQSSQYSASHGYSLPTTLCGPLSFVLATCVTNKILGCFFQNFVMTNKLNLQFLIKVLFTNIDPSKLVAFHGRKKCGASNNLLLLCKFL